MTEAAQAGHKDHRVVLERDGQLRGRPASDEIIRLLRHLFCITALAAINRWV